jgi:hypothetical protein
MENLEAAREAAESEEQENKENEAPLGGYSGVLPVC